MSALNYQYVCASCGTKFIASGAPETSYGEFVLRSESGEEAYLIAIGNVAIDEASQLIRRHPFVTGSDLEKSGEVAQKIFGAVCDPSPSGEQFHVDMMPRCPKCLSRSMASWEELYPYQLSQISMATQNRWLSMNEGERMKLIDRAIEDRIH